LHLVVAGISGVVQRPCDPDHAVNPDAPDFNIRDTAPI